MDKVKNLFYCEHCSCLHKRHEYNRTKEEARYCSQCKVYHSAQENDFWSEKNSKTQYLTCMDNKIYDVTELIVCRLDEVDFIEPNSHNVLCKLFKDFKNRPITKYDINSAVKNSENDNYANQTDNEKSQ